LLIPLGAAAGGFLAESIGLVDIYRSGAFIVGGLAIVLALGPLGRKALPETVLDVGD
jgi:uncharacterized membrane-anchored protein